MNQTQESRENCSNCRFYRDTVPTRELGECRRHAPPAYDYIRYYHLELLRFVALALAKIGRVDDIDENEDVATEATEAMADACWPRVRAQDWCGEYKVFIG